MPLLPEIVESWRKDPKRPVRVVAFGSSNTELCGAPCGRFNWVCWLETSLRTHVGKHVSVTNTGICGDTAAGLLGRFDRDVAGFAPHAVLVTIGGNDRRHVPVASYTRQLAELLGRVRALGAQPIVQTYYSLLEEDAGATPYEPFREYMQAAAGLAAREGVPCIDSFPAMDAWHARAPAEYRAVMQDPEHLNAAGHAIWGTLCVRAFGLPAPALPLDIATQVRAGLAQLRVK